MGSNEGKILKKVAIMTINSINFGNRLQNYALQETIKSFGYKVYTIRRTYDWKKQSIIETIKDLFRILLKTRKGLYILFDIKNINFSKYHASPNEAEKGIENHYDYFVAGSDQVWNPCYGHIVGKSDLLYFTDSKKKISYAASFGIDKIPTDKAKLYAEALDDFKVISVREITGVKIVQKLIEKDATVVLDPTMLLPVEQWRKIQKVPQYMPKGRYALIYILGSATELFNQYVEKILQHYDDIKLYDVLKMNKKRRSPAIGPSEFLHLIDHAEIILTDSFHATVFSTIFHRQVRTFPRKGIDISSRIASFATMVGCATNFTDQGIFYLNDSMDYDLIDKRINEEKIHSIEFLKKALL